MWQIYLQIVIQIVFILLFIRQILIAVIAWWTGTQSDAPFESTKVSITKKLVQGLKLQPDQKIYDLGSGSGKLIFTLAKLIKNPMVGVEKNWPLFMISQVRKFISPYKNRINFLHQDLFEMDLSLADVVYIYLSPKTNRRIKAKFEKELKPGAIVIALRWQFEFDQLKLIKTIDTMHKIYIYRKI
ncbi:MAG: class I SAM-dependent methyltransferase [Patescibacteria group bacterium]